MWSRYTPVSLSVTSNCIIDRLRADVYVRHAAALAPRFARRYRPVPYIDGELADVYAAADLVVSRAGASTLAELTAVGQPLCPHPLEPTAADEQRRNAVYLADR